MASLLTADNYRQGFLVDDELMAGITLTTEPSDSYTAFVLQHTTGEYLGYQSYSTLESALEAINRIPRSWSFEAISGGCGGGNCGKEGSCNPGGCRIKKCDQGACSENSTPQ
jgi:hypothetical protein